MTREEVIEATFMGDRPLAVEALMPLFKVAQFPPSPR